MRSGLRKISDHTAEMKIQYTTAKKVEEDGGGGGGVGWRRREYAISIWPVFSQPYKALNTTDVKAGRRMSCRYEECVWGGGWKERIKEHTLSPLKCMLVRYDMLH